MIIIARCRHCGIPYTLTDEEPQTTCHECGMVVTSKDDEVLRLNVKIDIVGGKDGGKTT